jgi:hypothetical protein
VRGHGLRGRGRPGPGAAPGQWTKAEISQFAAAAGAGGGDAQDTCVVGHFERDMSFGNAMAVTAVDPASGPSMSAAQVKAALDSKYDPPPADNTDWVTAMNDYVTAGEDYTGDNMSQQDDNPAQASQEITAGNSALASFNAANGGVLNGTIQSL